MLIRSTFGCALLLSLGWVQVASAQTPPAPTASAAERPPSASFPAQPAESPPAPAEAPPPAAPAATPTPAPQPLPPEPPAAEPEAEQRPVKKSRFFAALHLGGGYFHATSGSSVDTRRFSGATFSGMLALGGRIGPGGNVAIAGAIIRDRAYGLASHDAVIDGDEPHLNDVTFALWAICFLIDYAPVREAGLHFQALVGGGGLYATRDSGADIDDPSGYMAGLGVGYDFRLSRTLVAGGLLRATYAPLDSREVFSTSGTTVKVLVPALLLTLSTR